MNTRRGDRRIFIGLTEVSGYYAKLKKGFDELGVHAEFFPLQAHRFRYTDERYSSVPAFARYCVIKRIDAMHKNQIAHAFWFLMVLLSRLSLFIWAAVKFDAFLLGGGSSFFRFRELPLLRALGKKIVYTFHGTDSRPAYIDGFCESITPPQALAPGIEWPDEKTVRTYCRIANARKQNVRRVEKYANVVVNAPPQAQFHTRPFIVGLAVGLPFDLAGAPVRYREDGGPVRALHSPSESEAKGTKEIRIAVESLQRDGVRIDYVEIRGRPNAEVLAEIDRCDFVIDQLYSDSPMAGFAAEAAFYGKPAVVGGYYCERVQDDLRETWLPPSLYCRPERIRDAILTMATDRALRLQLGLRAKEFVESNWTARQVARRYLQLIDGNFPRDWLYDPGRNRYVHGMGFPESRLRLLLRKLIERAGTEALRLTEHPELERLFVNFAKSGNADA